MNINTTTYHKIVLLFLFSIASNFAFSQQSYDFEVTVQDPNGEALIGVTVFTNDQKFSAATDIDGKVLIQSVPSSDTINFTYIGYEKTSLPFHQIKRLGGRVIMEEAENIIAEIVVIGRRDEVEADIPYQVQNVSRKDIALTNSQTAADALRDHAGVFVQKSQMGGGSPVIRGFEANRVLLVVDGVRMNNAIYRNGHLQNSITIDASILERAEVIYGPGSLVYGSDALGGVVHFRTRDPKLYYGRNKNGFVMETNVHTRYASANREKTIHADIAYGQKKWGSLTSINFTDYDDLMSGSKRPEGYEGFGERYYFQVRDNGDGRDQAIQNVLINSAGDTIPNYNLQRGTAYSQTDFLQKIKFQPNDDLHFIANFQYSTSSNVPRYDALTEVIYQEKDGTDFRYQRKLKWLDWYYGPQKRFLTSVKTQIRNKSFFDKATIIGSFQKINEDRIKRKHKDSGNLTFNLEEVYVYSFTADFDKAYGSNKQHQISYGADYTHNDVISVAGKTSLETFEIRRGGNLSRYPLQGSNMDLAGAYASYKWRTKDSLITFNAGVRYAFVYLQSTFSPDDNIPWPRSWTEGKGIQNINTDITYGTGFTLNTPNKWQLRVLASKAFRSPNIDDFAKIRAKNDFVTIPNPELRPEKAYTIEGTIAKESGNLNGKKGSAIKLSGTFFYTYLRDAISRRNANLPDPNNEIPLEDQGVLIEYGINSNGDTIDITKYFTQANENATNGFVYGFSGNMKVRLGEFWSIKAGINYTYGRISYQEDYYRVEDGALSEEVIASIDTLVPLDHIPPLYGKFGIGFKKGKFKTEFVARFAGTKKLEDYAVSNIHYNENTGIFEINREGTTDNLDLTHSIHTFSDDFDSVSYEYLGTYGYTLLNLYTSWQFSDRFSLDFAVENITDRHYRPFASGVSGAGRNFIVALRGKF